MKAKELMLGNWVFATENGGCPLPHEIAKMMPRAGKIAGIDGDVVYLDFVDFGFMLDAIEPVPLTMAILKKNGWKYEFDKDKYMVQYDLGEDGKNCWKMWSITKHNLDIQRQDEKVAMYNLKIQRVVIPCDYVHQLQQALRLCDIEKEITI